jgi:2-oxoglutarate ferredoxin oxidoreductase subunit alpha
MMAKKILLKGNEAMAEAAIQANCRFYAGYPITPQNEVPEYMSRRLPQVGGIFIQAESELAAINMVFGAAATGTRCMTSSSSPGVSLKQEGISYIAGAELPCVIANMQRGGPGLGSIRASQGDYFQAVKGGGHGDYHLLVFAPSTVQELYDLTMAAFDYADYYRNPALILGDGMLAQMVEPFERRPYKPVVQIPPKDYILDGCKGRKPRVIKSLFLKQPAENEIEREPGVRSLMLHNILLTAKYERMKRELPMCEEYQTEDAKLVIAAYGITARIAKAAVNAARKQGMKVGLIRPITLWPLACDKFMEIAQTVEKFLVVEMSNGQFIEDVQLATRCTRPVEFLGYGGGWYPTPENIFSKVAEVYE